MARIRIAKATSGAAFVNKKKATEARLAAFESGLELEDINEDIFELQHHHLLRCLEKATVSSFSNPKNPPFSLFFFHLKLFSLDNKKINQNAKKKDREFVELDVPCGSGLGSEVEKLQAPISPSISVAVSQAIKPDKCWISSCCSKSRKQIGVSTSSSPSSF